MKTQVILCFLLFNATLIGAQVTDIDGNTYKTVIIGEQEWMAENLKTFRFQNGDSIPVGNDGSIWRSFENKYSPGVRALGWHTYYNHSAVIDERGLCPVGWKVPDNDDWQQLVDFLGGEELAGKKMKSTKYWTYEEYIWEDEDDYDNYTIEERTGNGTNESGFDARPAGDIDAHGAIIDYPTSLAFFWSSTPKINDAYYFKLSASGDDLKKSWRSHNSGLSVRCIKENP